MPANDKAEVVEILLTPGKQTLRVFLKTTTGIGAEAEQEIDFRPPPLADPVIMNLEEGFKFAGDSDRFETPVEVRFTPLAADYKLPVTVEAHVHVEGKTIGTEKVIVDASAGAATF